MTKDILVIGGGIVGVSTALWLQRAGQRVTVVDRLGWGEGTSHGNGGVLAACGLVPVTTPGLLRKAPGMLLKRDFPLFLRWGYLPRLAPWLIGYLRHANDADTRRIASGLAGVVADAVEQHQSLAAGTCAADFLAQGSYSYAYSDRAAFEADAYAWALRAEHGFVPQIFEGADVQRQEPGLGPDVGCLATVPRNGFVTDPGRYVKALGAEFEAGGGKLVIADVQDIVLTTGDRVEAVETSGGRIDCAQCVLTTGVWSKPLMAKLGVKVPLETERGYHIIFKGAQGGPRNAIMMAKGKFVATPMAEGLRCAGIVEFGGLEAGPSAAPFDLLRRQTKAAFPNLTWDGEVEWQGHRPATTDSLPLIGEVRATGVFTGFGHHHIGLTAGPKTGRLLAQLISGQPPNMDLTPYAPSRFV